MYRRRSPALPIGSSHPAPVAGPRAGGRLRNSLRIPLSALLLMFPVAAAEAGVAARFETRDLQRGSSELGRLLAQDGHYRMDRLEGDKLIASVLIKDGRSFVIDHAKRFWSEIDRRALEQMENDLKLSAAAFDQKISQMEPEQRELMTDTLAGPLPEAAPRELEATGEEAEKSGFPARRYRILARGTLVREIWATPWDKVPGASELKSAQSAMEAYYQRLTSIFAGVKSQLLGVPVYHSPENPFADFGKIDGFAVVTKNYAEGRSLTETVLLEVKEAPLAASEFEIPAGFERKAMDQ